MTASGFLRADPAHTPASLRVARGMTQGQLARKARTGISTIARLERDGWGSAISPRMGTVSKIASALGVEVSSYLDAMRRVAPERRKRRGKP